MRSFVPSWRSTSRNGAPPNWLPEVLSRRMKCCGAGIDCNDSSGCRVVPYAGRTLSLLFSSTASLNMGTRRAANIGRKCYFQTTSHPRLLGARSCNRLTLSAVKSVVVLRGGCTGRVAAAPCCKQSYVYIGVPGVTRLTSLYRFRDNNKNYRSSPCPPASGSLRLVLH